MAIGLESVGVIVTLDQEAGKGKAPLLSRGWNPLSLGWVRRCEHTIRGIQQLNHFRKMNKIIVA